jgi:hypothetical protein
MHSHLKTLAGAVAALALCASPTMAAAATSAPVQSVSPLIAVSVFGTQASAQTVCAEGASAAATAGAAAAAQGQAGCVLPATEAAPPPAAAQYVPPPPSGGNFGINWLLAGLGALALIAGLSTLFDDDDDDNVAQSPT